MRKRKSKRAKNRAHNVGMGDKKSESPFEKYRGIGTPGIGRGRVPHPCAFCKGGVSGPAYATTEILICADSRSSGMGSFAFFRPSM
jgi:hypothetical protein